MKILNTMFGISMIVVSMILYVVRVLLKDTINSKEVRQTFFLRLHEKYAFDNI